MKLTKKHIGQLFDLKGGDDSWCYQLIAVKGNSLLFYTFSTPNSYDISSNKFADWRPFEPQEFSRQNIAYGWKVGRRDPSA